MRQLILAILAAAIFIVPAGLSAGDRADPKFQLYDLQDRLYSLDRVLDEPGVKMVVVDFFSMSCAPCKRAMPRLAELATQRAGKGLRVVVVAVPASGERDQELERVKNFFQPLGNPFPVVFDKYSLVAKQYGVTNGGQAKLPQSFVIGPNGKILKRFEDMGALEEYLEKGQ